MKLYMTRRTIFTLATQVAPLMLVACYLVQYLQPKAAIPNEPAPLAQVIETPTAFLPSPTIIPTETMPEPPTQTVTSSPTIPAPTASPVVTTQVITASPVLVTPTVEPTITDHILWSDAGEYLGEERTVCGLVAGTNFANNSRGRPTFLNIGEDYPSPDRFVVLIWGEFRDNFSRKPENFYAGKTICAEGEIEEYEGIFEIEIRSPADIEIQQ